MIHTIHTLVVSMCACVYAAAVVSIRNYDIILNGCKNKLYYYIFVVYRYIIYRYLVHVRLDRERLPPRQLEPYIIINTRYHV